MPAFQRERGFFAALFGQRTSKRPGIRHEQLRLRGIRTLATELSD
jgi:hypothetical protein